MKTTYRSMMKVIFVSLLVTPLFISNAMTKKAQASGWETTIGGKDDDYGNSARQTTDGGYIVAGTTYSYGSSNTDIYLIKTNANGSVEWQKTFGGESGDEGYSVRQTSDGGYIVAGGTNSNVDGYDVYLIKTDAYGTAEWQKSFGGEGDDVGRSVQQTTDGGYIIAGSTYSYGNGYSDVYLIKTDAVGNVEWQKTFGGEGDDEGYSVQQTTDGGYIVAGSTNSYGSGAYDVYLIKTDAYGTAEWQKSFGGEDSDEGLFIQQTSDGGYIIVGTTNSYGAGSHNIYGKN